MKPIHLLAAACAIALAPLGTAEAQTVGIITTPVGSYSHSAGSALAKAINDKSKVHAVVQAQASTGFDQVDSGQVEFNVSNSFDATFFATGKGDYADKGKHPGFRHAAALIPYRVAMHVRADSNIKSIADLRGKHVGSGFGRQKTIGRIIEAHLAMAGLSYKDVVGVPEPNVVAQAQDFQSGKVDVLFFALGSAAVKQAAASVGGLRVLEVSTSPQALEKLHEYLPGAYIMKVNPAPNLDGVARPTNIVAFDMVLNTSTKVPSEVVYQVVKAIYESKKELVATFKPFVLFDPKNMAKASEGVPFDAGAEKFYKEVGIWKQ